MLNGQGESDDSSSLSDDLEVMKARTGDISDNEDSPVRRKRKVRGRGAVRSRERSLTPETRDELVVTKGITSIKKAPVNVPRENLGEDEGWGNENIERKLLHNKEYLKSPPTVEDITPNSRFEETAREESARTAENCSSNDKDHQYVKKKEIEEKLNPRDPQFVPRNNRFYSHDTERSTTIKERTPFGDDLKNDDSAAYTRADVFEPTGDGKWGHDLYNKIIDKNKKHTRDDHWGKSYGFNARRVGRNRNEVACLNWQKGRCNFGRSCRYLHDNAGNGHEETSHDRSFEKDDWNGTAQNAGGGVGVCFNWQKGNCSRGYCCTFSHDGNSRVSKNNIDANHKKEISFPIAQEDKLVIDDEWLE